MSTIIDLPYYFSIHDKHILEDEKRNFFGLLDIKQNRFYVLHRNHSLLKFLQIMLLKNFYAYSIVNFKHFNFDKHKDIDNHDCSDWGSTSSMIETLELEANTVLNGVELTKERICSLALFDVELQKKIFLIMDILTKLDNLFKKIQNYETDINKSTQDGHEELKTYFEIICPNDKNIINFINKEQAQIQTKLLTLKAYWGRILLFFYNIDLRNTPTDELLALLRIHIEMPTFELEQFHRLYKHPHNAYAQLCEILNMKPRY